MSYNDFKKSNHNYKSNNYSFDKTNDATSVKNSKDIKTLPFNKSLLDLDLNKLRVFISVLEEHEMLCDKEEKYPEAAICRDKVKVLKTIEEEKILRDLKEMHSIELNKLKEDYELEKSNTITSFNSNLYDLKNNFNQMLQHLKAKHIEEEEITIKEIENTYPSQPKFSIEVLELKKKMEYYAQRKEYEKANDVKLKIIKLCSQQEYKWKTEDYLKKIDNEKKKLNIKHNKELENLSMKINRTLNEFNEMHKHELENLELRYKNKIHIASYEHAFNENSFKKPSKYQIIKKVGI